MILFLLLYKSELLQCYSEREWAASTHALNITERKREREKEKSREHPKHTCFATEIQWNRRRIARFTQIRLKADELAMIPLWTHVLETVCECATSSVSHLLEVAHGALLIGCRGQEKLIQFVEAHTVSHRREGVEMAHALLKICKWEVTVFNAMGCSHVKTVIGPHESLNDTPVQIGVPWLKCLLLLLGARSRISHRCAQNTMAKKGKTFFPRRLLVKLYVQNPWLRLSMQSPF